MVVPTYRLNARLRDDCGLAPALFGPIGNDPDRHPGGEHDAGSIQAWDHLHGLLEPLIRRLARDHRNHLDPDDAAQEAWLEVLSRIDRYRQAPGIGGGFPAWAWVVARRRLLRLAASPAHRATQAHGSGMVSEPVDPRDGPPEAFERSEIRRAVRSALAEACGRMAGASHAVMALCWVDGHSVAEAAAILGVTPAQVRDRRRRALPTLRAALARRDLYPAPFAPPRPTRSAQAEVIS